MEHENARSPTPVCDRMRSSNWNPDWEPFATLDAAWTENFMSRVGDVLRSVNYKPE